MIDGEGAVESPNNAWSRRSTHLGAKQWCAGSDVTDRSVGTAAALFTVLLTIGVQ
jgi:hypothetical protein